MSKTLYVSDLDGTLLSSRSEVSQRSRQLLNEAIAAGALFTVATARTPATVSELLKGVNLQLPAIVMTGAALWNKSTGEYTDVQYIAPEVVAEMKELYRHFGLPTFIYRLIDNMIEICHFGPYSPVEREFISARVDNPYKHLESKDCDLDGMTHHTDNVVLFYAIQPHEEGERVYDVLCEMPVYPLFYHDIFGPEQAILEVFSSSTSKANAVKNLAREMGADRIVVFGDNINDLSMFAIADVGVAVGNAVEQVKQAADVVIDSNDTDAVARFIIEDMKR